MTLAVVQASMIFIALMIATWTGLLVSVAFLLPRTATRSEHLITSEPWWCFLRGIGMAVILLAGLAALSVPHPLVKLFGFILSDAVGAIIVIGAAGLAQTIGKRGQAEGGTPTFGMLLRGSLVYSLAVGFPFIGWFLFAPISVVMAAGAGVAAILPEQGRAFYPPSIPPTGHDYDISGRTGAIS